MDFLRSEVARLIGVSPSTIKNYDTWNLVSPRRDKNNYRLYSEDDVERLREIAIFQRLGMELNKDIQPFMSKENYDRNKVLSYQIAKLQEMKREIEKEIRLATMIRVLGPGMIFSSLMESSQNSDASSAKEEVEKALDTLGNPVFDDLFARMESLSQEESRCCDDTVQEILEEFQHLFKNEIDPADPLVKDAVWKLIDFTFSLSAPRYRKTAEESRHALMLYYLAVFSNDTLLKKQAESLAAGLPDYLIDCFYHQYEADWLEATEEILEASLDYLVQNPSSDALPESQLTQWMKLLRDFMGPFDPNAINPEEYLSVSRELLLDGYEPSREFEKQIDRLFRILMAKVSASEILRPFQGDEESSE